MQGKIEPTQSEIETNFKMNIPARGYHHSSQMGMEAR